MQLSTKILSQQLHNTRSKSADMIWAGVLLPVAGESVAITITTVTIPRNAAGPAMVGLDWGQAISASYGEKIHLSKTLKVWFFRGPGLVFGL